MKQLVQAACLVAILCLGASVGLAQPLASTASGSETPLALPADRVLRIATDTVEFEHHGLLPISSEVECYHHWEEESFPVPLAAVLVGFEEVVATVFQGEIIRFDVYDPLYIRTMQVAISTDQFRSIEHEQLRISPTSKLYVEEKGTGRGFVVQTGEEILVYAQDSKLHLVDGQGKLWKFDQKLYLWPDLRGLIQINSFQRGTGTKFFPQYRGRLELVIAEPGRFLVINEVSLEEYLYQVVPSEMPITWPLEALKAQAVAARTYAVAQVIYSRQGHLGFHVSDSTSSQVYNNQPEAANTTRAIQETAGQILTKEDGTIGSTYFYSTAPRAPLTTLAQWRNTEELALEGNSPWYRWQCTFTMAELNRLLPAALPQSVGTITGLIVRERDERGRVTVLGVQGTAGEATISGELNIRNALKPVNLKRAKDTLTSLSLLPSAFFFMESNPNQQGQLQSITLYGGGSGHGFGMSQWGAKGMAEAGLSYLDILAKYYPETRLITHSEQLRY